MGVEPSTTQLFLIRHCEVDEAFHEVLYGQLDVPLSARGREQSRAIAERLAGVEFEGVYSSDAQRARYLADLIAEPLGLDVGARAALRERNFGDWQGRTWRDVERDDPEHYTNYMNNRWLRHRPEAEGCSDLSARTLPCLESLVRSHIGGKIAVVAHAGTVRVVLAHALHIPPARAFAFQLKYGSLNLFEYRRAERAGLDDPFVRVING